MGIIRAFVPYFASVFLNFDRKIQFMTYHEHRGLVCVGKKADDDVVYGMYSAEADGETMYEEAEFIPKTAFQSIVYCENERHHGILVLADEFNVSMVDQRYPFFRE